MQGTTGTRPLPAYRTIDGLRFMRAFPPESLRTAMEFVPKAGDIVLVSYPKCGSHWMTQILQLILHRGVPASSSAEYELRTPFIDLYGTHNLENMAQPRLMRTHLPFDEKRYSKNAKYIYLTRNPWDCCVSFFHHTKMLPSYEFKHGTFEDYFELFINGQTDYGDYFDHVLSWYSHRDFSNILIVTYEDLKTDTKSKVVEVASFLGEEYRKMLTEDGYILNAVLEKSSIEWMKNIANTPKESAAARMEAAPSWYRDVAKMLWFDSKGIGGDISFVRNGIIGDSIGMLTSEQKSRMRTRVEQWDTGSGVLSLWNVEELRSKFY